MTTYDRLTLMAKILGSLAFWALVLDLIIRPHRCA